MLVGACRGLHVLDTLCIRQLMYIVVVLISAGTGVGPGSKEES